MEMMTDDTREEVVCEFPSAIRDILAKFADTELESCSNMFTDTLWMHINGWFFIMWLSWVEKNQQLYPDNCGKQKLTIHKYETTEIKGKHRAAQESIC